jgi:hypothetical protein
MKSTIIPVGMVFALRSNTCENAFFFLCIFPRQISSVELAISISKGLLMHKFSFFALIAASCVLWSSSVYATNLQITVTEKDKSGVSNVVAYWTQDQNPDPVDFTDGYYTTVSVWDTMGLSDDTEVTWYSSSNNHLGGFTNYSEDFNMLAPQGYASSEDAPVFLPGNYIGADLKADSTYVQATYSVVTIPDAPAPARSFARFSSVFRAPAPDAVPEPGTWVLMIAGFGIIGFAIRRTQKSVAAIA